jgi:arylsulfatase A-like enzyme
MDDLKLGTGSGIDYLGIGFSAMDYIGHSFGPDSREVEDGMLALDRTIGALLEKLDRSVGAGQYVVALTSDHGVAPIPEQARLQGGDAGRVDPREVAERIESALAQKLGAGRYIAQFVPPSLYFAPGIAGRLHSDANLWRALQQAALAVPGVAGIVQSPGSASTRGTATVPREFLLNLYPERSGDAWIDLKPGWIFSGRTPAGWNGGTTHGSGRDYDQRVSILLFGSGIKPGRYTMAATPADIAPTLAALSGISIARTDGRVLSEALRAPAAQPMR